MLQYLNVKTLKMSTNFDYNIQPQLKLEIDVSNLIEKYKEPVKSFVGMFRKMKISLYDN